MVEIPIGAEWGDNIVAYWRPSEPLAAERPFHYSYRLHWSDGTPQTVRRVMQTRVGLNGDKPMFVIDYEAFQGDDGLRSAVATTSSGTTSKPIIQRNAHTGGIRCFFTLDSQGHTTADLRLVLLNTDKAGAAPDGSAEMWMYRWIG